MQAVHPLLTSLTDMSLKPFKLYTWATPNGFKVTVFLEELKLAYPGTGLDYE